MTSDTIKSQLSWRLPKPVLQADPMLTAPILPMLVRLSLPNMMAMLAMAVVTIAETAYVGALGTPPLAGLALVFPLVMLQQMQSAGAMGGGVSSAISRALGAGDEQRASALAFTQYPEDAIENAPIVDTRHAARLVGEHCVNDAPLAVGKLVAHIGRLPPSVTRRPRRPISAAFCP